MDIVIDAGILSNKHILLFIKRSGILSVGLDIRLVSIIRRMLKNIRGLERSLVSRILK